MRVTFDPAAAEEIDRIFAWIAKDSPRAAYDLIARIEAKVMRLETLELTHMGRPGLVAGTRELLEWPYIIVYKVKSGMRLSFCRLFTARKIARSRHKDAPRASRRGRGKKTIGETSERCCTGFPATPRFKAVYHARMVGLA
jgi:plasmid stabilization system protein ParE